MPPSTATEVPSQLTWDVYVTAEEPIVTDDLAPGTTERRWPPISATLISAGRDAVLVDLYDQVLKLHPGRLNPGALWTSARVLKP
jgi:hypothetical protein